MPYKAVCTYYYSFTVYFMVNYTLRYYMIYGDVSDVILRVPQWTDMFGGRIVSLILYSRCGWCGWHFNRDSWVYQTGMP